MLKTKPKAGKFCACGKSVHCKEMCRSCYDKHLKEANPIYKQRQLDNTKKWHSENVEQRKLVNKMWRAKQDPEYMRAYKRKKKLEVYGITVEEYEIMLENQNGVCAICEKSSTKALAVDHDHFTGKVRGLLCFRCNFGLTYFSESSSVLKRASEYLHEV